MYSIKKQKEAGKEFSMIEVKQQHIEVTFMDYGAAVLEIRVPNKDGVFENVVLSYNDLSSYINNVMCVNAIVGPSSGRIENGSFSINAKTYQLEKNFMGKHNLHGGSECFSYRQFYYEVIDSSFETKVIFSLKKEALNSSYPGEQDISISYTVKDSSLEIEFNGTTSEDALLNLTSHLYFNLSGNLKEDIMNHSLLINANKYIELDDESIPRQIQAVKNTFFDFTKERLIKEGVTKDAELLPAKGIDHPYMLNEVGLDIEQVKLTDPISKRLMKVYTTYPCIVVYTHNYPDGKLLENNTVQRPHQAICFETQFEPNGIKNPLFHRAILRKDEMYYHKTIYQFSVGE